ncbi:beta strand repeat-containing protein, partial [Uliginosibacterium sediminicola]
AGSDYSTTPSFSNNVTYANGFVTVPANVSSFTVSVPTTDDSIIESTETYTLSVGGKVGTGSILDNDTLSVSSVSSASAVEGTAVIHTVTLNSYSTAGSTTFALSLADVSATAGSDYTTTPSFSNNVTYANGFVTVPANVSSFTVSVPTTDDSIIESTETYTLSVGGKVGTGSILDNDTLSVSSVSSASAVEGTAIVHTVTLNSYSTAGSTTFALSLADVSATAGSDYSTTPSFSNNVTYANGFVTVPANVSSFTVSVPTVNDTIVEQTETYTLSVGGKVGTGSILDNDTLSVSSVSSATVTEGTAVVHTVTFNSTATYATSFALSLADVTTSGTADYTAPTFSAGVTFANGFVTVQPNVSSFTITVPTVDDTIHESTETYTVTVGGVRGTGTILDNDTANDTATVNESALSTGTGGGTTTAIGNLLSNDGSGTSITSVASVTDGGTGDLDSRAGYIQVADVEGGKTIGFLTVDTAGTGVGDYTYTLTAAADNSATANNSSITSNFSYVTDTLTASLGVTVVDDTPLAYSRTVEVAATTAPSYNLVLVLDISRSMTEAFAGGEVLEESSTAGVDEVTTRLEMAKTALIALVKAYYALTSDVSVKIVTFAGTASILNNNTAYASEAAVIAAITAITVSTVGGTNYQDALVDATTAFGTVDSSVTNIAYFVSDGAPTASNGNNVTTDTTSATSSWSTFTATNSISSYAVGIGQGVSNTTYLNAINNIDSDKNGTKDAATLVPDLNDLSETLTNSVNSTLSKGNLLTGSLNSTFGADGGYIQSVSLKLDTNGDSATTTADGTVTFTYNPTTNQITWTTVGSIAAGTVSGSTLTLDASNGFTHGTLTINFATGDYSIAATTVGDSYSVSFVARDNDGDTSSATLNVGVVNGAPTARNDFDTLLPTETAFTGNVITGMSEDPGRPINASATLFTSTTGNGADTITDDAKVTSITFAGQTISLTSASSGTLSGGTYTVTAAGVLTWSNTTTGASLTFNKEGYYSYTPATADRPTQTLGTTHSVSLTNSATAATNNGLTVTAVGINTATTPDTTTTGTVTYGSVGVGVSGSGVTTTNEDNISDSTQVDNLESLIFTFSSASYAQGVGNVVFTINANSSNLGSTTANGGSSSLTYSIYSVDGHLLGQVTSTAEGTVALTGYTNIGYIEVQTSSDAEAIISAISFQGVSLDTTTTGVTPVDITYTLTDSTGDTSTATLELTTINNLIHGSDTTANTITGTSANDEITGGAGNDTLSGGGGHDIISGKAGNDSITGGSAGYSKLYGDEGNDTIIALGGHNHIEGGAGNDTMTASSAGADTFVWHLGDQGSVGTPAVDTIIGFNSSTSANVLNLQDLLQGESHTGTSAGDLTNYLHFTVSGGNTTIHVSTAGGFVNGYSSALDNQQIVLQGVDLTNGGTTTDTAIIQALLTANKLVTD